MFALCNTSKMCVSKAGSTTLTVSPRGIFSRQCALLRYARMTHHTMHKNHQVVALVRVWFIFYIRHFAFIYYYYYQFATFCIQCACSVWSSVHTSNFLRKWLHLVAFGHNIYGFEKSKNRQSCSISSFFWFVIAHKCYS